MGLLSRRYHLGCLACCFGLVAFPLFSSASVLDDWYWYQGPSGNVYKISRSFSSVPLRSVIPSDTQFSAASSGGGVIERIAPSPLTIDGFTGEVLPTISRSLSVGDIVSAAGDLVKIDNPVGATLTAVSLLATVLVPIYDDYGPAVSSSVPGPPSGISPSCSSTRYYVIDSLACTSSNDHDTYPSSPSFPMSPSSWDNWLNSSPPPSACVSPGTVSYNSREVLYSDGSGPFASECPGGSQAGTYVPPSSSPVSSSTALDYFRAHPNQFATDAANYLNANPSQSSVVANDIAPASPTMSDSVPFRYALAQNPTVLDGSPTTTTSTNPATGDSTVTTSTPTVNVTPSASGHSLDATKQTTTTVQSCTSAGSCTTTNTTVSDSSPVAKFGTFIPPTALASSSPSVSPSSLPLSLSAPSVSPGVCPSALSFSALGSFYSVPLTPLCNLATDASPYVKSLGAVGAAIVILR